MLVLQMTNTWPSEKAWVHGSTVSMLVLQVTNTWPSEKAWVHGSTVPMLVLQGTNIVTRQAGYQA